ncbi:hypothetical protein WMY93_014875 [Mugilogobius chulae]|uniref:NAD(P)(+)--arginine ADP-ribosyltransferase n=1 Tax=Mugilogobius chulae TaxID=88201 RepID=A0AAW0P073_9GOBI
MKTTMLTFFFCLVLPSFAMGFQQLATIPLSMMNQSVDDMYDGCNEAMAKKAASVYFPREIKNQPFNEAWRVAKSFAKTKYNNRKDKELTLNQVQAIYVYTQEFPRFYENLNAAVRVGADSYMAAFPFHAFHFWLTSAIQILSDNKQCQTTYRRNNVRFRGQVNQEIRFGYFASSSKEPSLTTFGKETCFHIETCFGASIENYSGKSESEVLIPPYEKFKIIRIETGSYKSCCDPRRGRAKLPLRALENDPKFIPSPVCGALWPANMQSLSTPDLRPAHRLR